MLEDDLKDTFARHEDLVPAGAHIIDKAASTARTRRRRRWMATSAGAALALVAAVVAPVAARWAMPLREEPLIPGIQQPAPEVTGRPLNFLLIGLDKRVNSTAPVRADSVMIAHVPADRSGLYLVTVARDVLVTPSPGTRGKLAETYALRGFPATAAAVTSLTGVTFDGGATIEFTGLKKLVAALGGVHMCIDQVVRSEHHDRNGRYHTSTSRDGVQPYVYRPGCRTLKAWEALDYARQRQGLPTGSYDRDRHIAQMFRAVLRQAKESIDLTDLATLDALTDAIGPSLVLDTGGIAVGDLAKTLRPVLDKDITVVTTPIGGYHSKTIDGLSYQVMDDNSKDFFAALKADRAADWLADHPGSDWPSK
ncbi:hypothetical protein GCM10009682_07640 [Luedemannella flava]|uniref:Cell envelope-related transcriptional attenuator domain-containing protein n=1 Tax=Luedemannella flava TaxID=349316 RepID=A0ABN2LH62_9ACTN